MDNNMMVHESLPMAIWRGLDRAWTRLEGKAQRGEHGEKTRWEVLATEKLLLFLGVRGSALRQ